MENTQNYNYIVDSLELHLFFARIMKEHAFFLKVGFLPPAADLAQEGEYLLRQFEMLLSRAVDLSNRVVRNRVLESGDIVTPFTDRAECQTQRFTGTFLDRQLTARTLQLRGRDCREGICVSPQLWCQVQQLNRDGLVLVNHIINYKERLLDGIEACRLFTVNYPLLIEHILREARLYRAYLMKLEGLMDCSCQELRNTELFWNQIMMEHAMFIRGLLDPTEAELIDTADGFAEDYRRLLETCGAANDRCMLEGTGLTDGRCSFETSVPLDDGDLLERSGAFGGRGMCNVEAHRLTEKFRDFKKAGVQGIEACQIRSIILPLLADHVLREANHYLRLLEEG